jgi:carotenoid cleavage dioxygenase
MEVKVEHAFPDRPQFQGFMKPCRMEGEVQALEVHGDIPKEIDGTFYRVMPDPQLPPFVQDDPVMASNTFYQRSRMLIEESIVVQR